MCASVGPPTVAAKGSCKPEHTVAREHVDSVQARAAIFTRYADTFVDVCKEMPLLIILFS